MKNLICALLLSYCCSGFAQLQDFIQDYGDTTYNDKNLIESITFKEYPSSEGGVATFLYYPTDTIMYIEYKDHEGFAQYEYNKYGHLTGVRVDHYRALKNYNFYNYEYGNDGIVNAVYTYDSTKTLTEINKYKYNEDGDPYEQTTHSGNGDLLYLTTYQYNSNKELIGSETFLSSGLLRVRTVAASVSPNGLSSRYSYTYDDNNQLEKINYIFYKENGDFEDFSYVLFTHEDGELKTFKVSSGDYEKVKKKHKENEWIKEYCYITNRNKK